MDEIAATKSQSGSGSEVSLAEYPFLTAFEIDLICEGRKQNAAKARHLESLGLKVKLKPNGSPLVGRKHFEVTMSLPDQAGNNSNEPNWSIE